MKKLILDYSKWRCGEMGEHRLGDGATALKNENGYMCCLGQFCTQLADTIKEEDIIEIGEPFELYKDIPQLTKYYIYGYEPYCENTALSGLAIEINDEPSTTPQHKIELLKDLFAKHGYEIIVINQPSTL